jgi:hypothetical protein
MPRKEATSLKKQDELSKLDADITQSLSRLEEIRKSRIYLLWLTDASIDNDLVEAVYNDLRTKYKKEKVDKFEVLLHSSGGQIDPAYNLSLLFRRYASKEFNVIVPRWAKSAATLIACAANTIYMTPIAELGPVDPQITMFNPLEKRLENFSPLDIGSTLDLIRDEFKNGHKELANGLLNRLQFPLTLGGIKKSLDVGRNYLERLLSTGMHKENSEAAGKIARCLVNDYSTHGFCIEIDEAKRLGLTADLLEDQDNDIVWELTSILKKKDDITSKKKKEEIIEQIKELPPDVLQKLINDNDQRMKNRPCSNNGKPMESGEDK